jgi:hypothetical protein
MTKMCGVIVGVATASLAFATYASADMGSDPSSKQGTEMQPRSKQPLKPGETDISNTKGSTGEIPSRYTVMPVARGQKIDVNNELIGDTVMNQKGEELGKLERLIKDSETQKVEYAMISIGDTGEYRAFPWSDFKVNKEKGNVVLNITKEQLQPGITQKDLSPDVTKVVEDQLKTLRKREEGLAGKREGLGVTQQPASAGPSGESQVGGSGPSGPRGLPPGEAPQFEGGKQAK